MKQFNRQTGMFGEEAAANLLQEKGFKILQRNFGTKFGEIDIICQNKEVLVFVEVKTKTGDMFGEPWEMIDQHKIKQIKMMADVYLTTTKWQGQCRIDVVGVWLDEGGNINKLNHWENVD
jgi:putative endonuclease